MADLGSMMSPVPKEEQDAGTWSDLVQDPVARSALLGMGLQLMTGGWGNATQQLAAGLGAGATSAAGTSEALQKQLESEDKMASAEANQSANRANALKVAQIGADSRAEVANIRSAAMLERTQLVQGAKGPDEMRLYNDVYKKTHDRGMADKFLTRETDEVIQQRAVEAAQRALVEARVAKARLPGGDAGASSPNPAPVAPGAVPGRLPVPGAPGTPAAQTSILDRALADPKMGPVIQQKLSTPEGQMELIGRNKANRVLVEEWNKRKGTPLDPYATINGAIQRGR